MKPVATGKKLKIYYFGIALILAWILTPVFLKAFLYRGVELFHAPVEAFVANAGEVQDYWALRLRSKNHLIEDYRKLSRTRAHERMKLDELKANQIYVDRLERLLAMSPVADYHSAYARVIRRDVNAWSENLKIDKGAKDGIAPGQAVICDQGLVGRIGEVQARTATVILVSSPAFRITVNVVNDERTFAYGGIGQLFGEPLLGIAHNIPQDISVSPNSSLKIFTSGLGGDIPSGILVGELITVDPELEGLFQKGTVRLDDRLKSLREVAVLIPLELGN